MPVKVVHCKKAPYDIYIGRPSKWGNPYSHKEGTLARYKVDTREQAIEAYRNYVLTNKHLMASLWELHDKTLGCWCDPLWCHGHILQELVDGVPKVNYQMGFYDLEFDPERIEWKGWKE